MVGLAASRRNFYCLPESASTKPTRQKETIMPVVKDLLADYKFKTANGFGDLKPEVSIVLPTYRRAENGLFKAAVESLLSQDFKNIELIIVDDCSTDGTETIIDEFITTDPRVASVRYKKNVGQPAISVNLALELSRGQKILCAFDDNEFTKDGITALLRTQHADPKCKISFGQTTYRVRSDPKTYYFGDKEMLSQNLQVGNQIGHSATLVDRSVYEKIGLYDVNIGIVRYWDWDFWTRANLYFGFTKVDCVVNHEKGMLQSDSLGNSFKVHNALVQEIMHKYRNGILSFTNWKNVDITDGTGLSLYGRLILKQIAAQEFKGRFGVPSVSSVAGHDGYVLLITVRTGCTELGFDVTDGRVLFVHPSLFWQDPMDFIRGASVVIFVREVDATTYSLSLQLRQLGIAYYFYTDDNLFCEEYVTKHNPYNGTPQTKDLLRNAKGILAGTPALGEEMAIYNDSVVSAKRPLTCTMTAPLDREFFRDVSHFDFNSNPSPSIKIGYISSFKSQGFIALKDSFVELRNKLGLPIDLYCWVFPSEIESVTEAFAGIRGINIHIGSFEYSYPKFCMNLRDYGLHFLVHVNTDALKELYPYKTYNYLITASFCSAVPIIINRPPWDRLKKSNPELAPLIPDTTAELAEVIESVVLQPSLAETYLTNCQAFIDRAYPIQHNVDVLDKLIRDSDGPYLMNATSEHRVEVLPSDPMFYRHIQTKRQFYASVKGCLAFAYRRVVRAFQTGIFEDIATTCGKLRKGFRTQ
jgi:glycosyltransferase involved in cell wall biosynthesis